MKAKYSKQEIMVMDVFHKTYTREDLEHIRRTLAKQVNQRLRRVEAGKSLVSGESLAKEQAGFSAEARSILREQGSRKGFSEVLAPKGYGKPELRREIAQLQSLLGMKSSTVKGWHDIERARINTFKEMGISEDIASDKAFYDFLNSEDFKEMSRTFDSAQIVKLMKGATNASKVKDRLIESFKEYKKLDSDERGLGDFQRIYNAKKVE